MLQPGLVWASNIRRVNSIMESCSFATFPLRWSFSDSPVAATPDLSNWHFENDVGSLLRTETYNPRGSVENIHSNKHQILISFHLIESYDC